MTLDPAGVIQDDPPPPDPQHYHICQVPFALQGYCVHRLWDQDADVLRGHDSVSHSPLLTHFSDGDPEALSGLRLPGLQGKVAESGVKGIVGPQRPHPPSTLRDSRQVYRSASNSIGEPRAEAGTVGQVG